MNRVDVLNNVKKYFNIKELVCKDCYTKFGEKAWGFFTTESLYMLYILRTQILKVPMTINDYMYGGSNTQRGLRCNLCPLVKNKKSIYLSAHMRGIAFDIVFSPKTGMTAAKARKLIKENSNLFPFKVRIEKDVTWLHIDCMDMGENVPTVYEFS